MASSTDGLELMRIEEVAELTGIPENTLRHWRAIGCGPRSAKLGRRIVYRRRDVVDWVDAAFSAAAPSD